MKAIYPLSADPIHTGHIYNIQAGLGIFDSLHVALGNNTRKNYLFSQEERIYLARTAINTAIGKDPRITIGTYDGMLKNYALENGYDQIIRGSRNTTDFSYEKKLADYHAQFGLKTIIIPSSPELEYISSTVLKDIVRSGGIVQDAHPAVKQALEEKVCNRLLVGVTGSIGAGKTTVSKGLKQYVDTYIPGANIHHIDIDRMVKSIYTSEEPLYKDTCAKIMRAFGDDLFTADGFNRARIIAVLDDPDNDRKWTEILRKPFMVKLEQQIKDLEGIVLIDAAYLVEKDMLGIVNYNVINVYCDESTRYCRIAARDNISAAELATKTRLQYDPAKRERLIVEAQEHASHGKIINIDSASPIDYEQIFKSIGECRITK